MKLQRITLFFVCFVIVIWSKPVLAGTTLDLPYIQDFDGLTDLNDDNFLCPQAEDRCDFQVNENGTSNEYLLETETTFSGSSALRFVMDNETDSEAFRAEFQSHPPSDDIHFGDVLWVAYALQISADNPDDDHWFDLMSQLKLLNTEGTRDICQIYLLAEDNRENRFSIREEFGGCGGGNTTHDTGIAATHGVWHRVVMRVDLSHSGGFELWVNSDDPDSPTFQVGANIFPSAVDGQSIFYKMGVYKAWYRSDIHPEDRIPAEWSYLFDNLRLCIEGTPPCDDRSSAFNWALPRESTVNEAPVVDAGEDRTVPLSTTMTGTVTDDGLPEGSTLTTSWSQVEGPAGTNFDTSSPTTAVSFLHAGIYTLRLTASDGELESSDDVVLTVDDPCIEDCDDGGPQPCQEDCDSDIVSCPDGCDADSAPTCLEDCEDAGTPPTNTDPEGCGCAVSTGRSAAPVVIFSLLGLLWIIRRTRRS